MEKRIYYLSNTVISNTKREKNIQVFNVFTQVGVKQLTDFLRTVTAASDLVDCTLVNCDHWSSGFNNLRVFWVQISLLAPPLFYCTISLNLKCSLNLRWLLVDISPTSEPSPTTGPPPPFFFSFRFVSFFFFFYCKNTCSAL